MLVRTVLDCRSSDLKYLNQLLLLASSWHSNGRALGQLEVLVIGAPQPRLAGFLAELGVNTLPSHPSEMDGLCKTCNTIQGAYAPEDHSVLLVDNDVYIRSDATVFHEQPQVVAGALPGWPRVSGEQWAEIREKLDLHPLPTTETPLSELRREVLDEGHKAKPMPYVYPNGGVTVLPSGSRFASTWEAHVAKIHRHFADHPLRDRNVVGSNMAALATAIGQWGAFRWLPIRTNYQPICFSLGLAALDEITFVHMTGRRKALSQKLISEWIPAYWEIRVFSGIEEMRLSIGDAEYDRRLAIAQGCLSEQLSLIKEYGLDNFGG
jgi:hypothetical protein